MPRTATYSVGESREQFASRLHTLGIGRMGESLTHSQVRLPSHHPSVWRRGDDTAIQGYPRGISTSTLADDGDEPGRRIPQTTLNYAQLPEKTASDGQ